MKRKLFVIILCLWLGTLALYSISLKVFPNVPTPLSGHLNQILQSLLFFVAVFIFVKEPNRKNKYIFLNFILYFLLGVLSFAYDFVGVAFLAGKYSRFLFSQYMMIGYAFTLSIAVVYLVIDLLFQEWKTLFKYSAVLTIVLVFFGIYFASFFSDPMYLYSTQDIKQWGTLNSHVSELKEVPSSVSLANEVTLQTWESGKAVGDLYPEENLRRIEELLPYLEGDNWRILFWKPIYMNAIYTDVLIIGFILLFFGYQIKKDPPQGAYIDKIMFLILLLQSMDILHNWAFIKSVEWASLAEIFSVGQYITVFAELLMVLFFSLRLRFITSVQGEFYETELVTSPHQVSRWRDWVDNLVLSQFFNFRLFNGRLFHNPSEK